MSHDVDLYSGDVLRVYVYVCACVRLPVCHTGHSRRRGPAGRMRPPRGSWPSRSAPCPSSPWRYGRGQTPSPETHGAAAHLLTEPRDEHRERETGTGSWVDDRVNQKMEKGIEERQY